MTPAIRGNSYAEGNSGGGAPVGNSNAVGNNGGAPVNNSNAAKHHGWSDSLKHYHRLGGEARAHTDELIECVREEYADYHRIELAAVEQHIVEHREFDSEEEVCDAFRKLAAMYDQRRRTDGPVAEDGFVVEEEVEVETDDGEIVTYTTHKANPALDASHRLFSKRRTLQQDLGLIENERRLSVWIAQRDGV